MENEGGNNANKSSATTHRTIPTVMPARGSAWMRNVRVTAMYSHIRRKPTSPRIDGGHKQHTCAAGDGGGAAVQDDPNEEEEVPDVRRDGHQKGGHRGNNTEAQRHLADVWV